jgi:RNA polymerase sigma factor (sigma-70 family)
MIEGCIRAERVYQKALYERYASKMLGVCMRYAESREEAEDMLQEGFIRVYQSITTYRKMGSFEGWVRRVMVFTAINMYKSRLRKYKEELMHEDFDQPVQDDMLDRISAREITSLIQMMPEGYRVIFNLFAVEGYSHKEIAEQLNIAVGTSKSQFARARAHLQQLIMKHTKGSYGRVASSG